MAYERETTANLKRMIAALSLHPWLNTPEEKQRMIDAKAEIKRRAKRFAHPSSSMLARLADQNGRGPST